MRGLKAKCFIETKSSACVHRMNEKILKAVHKMDETFTKAHNKDKAMTKAEKHRADERSLK